MKGNKMIVGFILFIAPCASDTCLQLDAVSYFMEGATQQECELAADALNKAGHYSRCFASE